MYLCELLDVKVRRIIEVLLYLVEGYNWVLLIFKDWFGKYSEIVKVYVKEIFELFYIFIGNFKRIYEFYDKLFYSV